LLPFEFPPLPPVVEKLLMSALANAEHNYDMNTDELIVKEAYANDYYW
jgi:large subunit ribosomal protein L22